MNIAFVKKHWKKILIGLVVLFFIQKIYSTFIKEKTQLTVPETTKVELFNLYESTTPYVDAFCAVETIDNAPVVPESGGKVTSVSVSEGDSVKKGDVLFSLENIQERVGVQNARVALSSAKLALSDLLANNDKTSTASILKQTEQQQNILIENAKNAYLNTDIRAYPEDFDEDSLAPTISGNYICEQEGEYVLELYSSAAKSGSTIRLSGLEKGLTDVSTDYAVPLGECGLEIVFPIDFRKTSTWIVPVPNTRSANHVAAKKNYENALSSKDIVLNNLEASPEQIAQQRARVTQAELQLESAQDSLSKTIIKAPIDGVISSFDIKNGDFISMGSEVGRVQSIGVTELISYVNADEKQYMKKGNKVRLLDNVFSIESVSPIVDAATKKIKLIIGNDNKDDLVEGTEYGCQIERSVDSEFKEKGDGSYTVPLSAISIIGIDPYVFEVLENKVVAVPVQTGALLGDMIVIYAELSNGSIINDARGIRTGQLIE